MANVVYTNLNFKTKLTVVSEQKPEDYITIEDLWNDLPTDEIVLIIEKILESNNFKIKIKDITFTSDLNVNSESLHPLSDLNLNDDVLFLNVTKIGTFDQNIEEFKKIILELEKYEIIMPLGKIFIASETYVDYDDFEYDLYVEPVTTSQENPPEIREDFKLASLTDNERLSKVISPAPLKKLTLPTTSLKLPLKAVSPAPLKKLVPLKKLPIKTGSLTPLKKLDLPKKPTSSEPLKKLTPSKKSSSSEPLKKLAPLKKLPLKAASPASLKKLTHSAPSKKK